MNWKSKKLKSGKETYQVDISGHTLYIEKDPKVDTEYFVKMSGPYDNYWFWARGEDDIKVKLARRKIPKEIVDEFKIIP